MTAHADAARRRRRAEAWIRRYAPPELLALFGALSGYLLLQTLTHNGAAAAYGAAVGDNLAYYGLLLVRDVRARSGRVPAAIRALLVEFGPAEALDSAVVRPACTAIASAALGPVAGVIAAKLVADLVFYAPVIATYELRTRCRERDSGTAPALAPGVPATASGPTAARRPEVTLPVRIPSWLARWRWSRRPACRRPR